MKRISKSRKGGEEEEEEEEEEDKALRVVLVKQCLEAHQGVFPV